MALRTRAKNANLRKWVASKPCPTEDYFKSIDGYRAICRRHFVDAPDPYYDFIVTKLADLLNREESLYSHLAKERKDTSNPDDWDQMCLAAAWVILDRYDKAIANGTWEPT